MILADSILQTASIARCVSVAVTATDHTIFASALQAEERHNYFITAIRTRQRPYFLGPEARTSFGPEHLVRADRASIVEGLLANLGLSLPARPVLLVEFHKGHRSFDRLFL